MIPLSTSGSSGNWWILRIQIKETKALMKSRLQCIALLLIQGMALLADGLMTSVGLLGFALIAGAILTISGILLYLSDNWG